MEQMNILLTGGICAATVLGVGVALASFITDFTSLKFFGLISSLLIYISIVLLFIIWLRRKLK